MNTNSFKTNPDMIVMVEEPKFPNPVDDIWDLLGGLPGTWGCPNCCSGIDVWFYLKSKEGNSHVIGGFAPKTVTKLDDKWVLAAGISGGAINISDLANGETVALEPLNVAVLAGPKEVMYDKAAVQAALKTAGESLRRKESGRSYDAIGLMELVPLTEQ